MLMNNMKVHDFEADFEKAIDHLKQELSNLRTGRAHPSLVDSVLVEAYGDMMPIKSVGSIAVTDARTLQIEPWDKSLLKAVEKGIIAANIGLTPVVDSKVVRLNMPQLTEENRKKLVVLMNKKLEEARVAVRAVREKVRTIVIETEKEKKISEDERYRLQEDLEKVTSQYIDEIKSIGGEKEVEIMTV